MVGLFGESVNAPIRGVERRIVPRRGWALAAIRVFPGIHAPNRCCIPCLIRQRKGVDRMGFRGVTVGLRT